MLYVPRSSKSNLKALSREPFQMSHPPRLIIPSLGYHGEYYQQTCICTFSSLLVNGLQLLYWKKNP